VGDTTVYPAPAVGFPSMSVNSKLSNTVSVATSVPPPTFTAIIPDNGVRSTTVSYTIIGTNFEPGLTSVAFRSTTGTILNPTTLTSVTPTQITGTIAIPAKSAFGSYTVSITTVHGGTVTRIGAFSVTPPPPAPMLIRVTPATATRNAVWSYSVFGTNLQFGQPTVTLTRSGFPDIPTTVTSVTPTVIQGNILIPASTSPGMWGIKVTTNGGTATTRNSVRIQ